MKKYASFLGLGLLSSLVLFFTLNRLTFGLLQQDEGYFLSLVYRLALGDRFSPYAPTDFFAYLIFPLTSIYLKTTSTTEGFILYSHFIYWVFTLVVFGFIFFGLSRFFDRKLAFILSLFYPCYLHYYPVLFYTNLGVGFLTMALFLSLVAIKSNQSALYFGPVGGLLGLGTISHPGGIPLGILAYFIGLKTTGHFSKRNLYFLLLGFISSLLLFFLVSGFDLGNIRDAINYHLVFSQKTAVPPSLDKFLDVVGWFNDCNPFYGRQLWILFVPLCLYLKAPKYLGYYIFLILVPIIYIFVLRGLGNPSSKFQIQALAGGGEGALIRYISLLGLAIYFLIRKNNQATSPLFHLIVLPSFATAFGLAFTSNTLMGNLGIGCLPAFICSVGFLFLFVRNLNPSRPNVAALPAIVFLLMLVPFSIQKNPGEQNLVLASKGAYAGLKISKEVKELNDNLTDFFRSEKLPAAGRVFFNTSPLMGYSYLYSKLKPGVATTWGCFAGEDLCKRLQEPFNNDITVIINFDKSKIDLKNADKFEFSKSVQNIDVCLRKNSGPPRS